MNAKHLALILTLSTPACDPADGGTADTTEAPCGDTSEPTDTADESTCAVYPPGICWCGEGCDETPPAASCEPVPMEMCAPAA